MEYAYEVALSFAGEDRAFADAVAKGLRMCNGGRSQLVNLCD